MGQPETLGITTAQDWVLGTRVNLERALKIGDRLGGHFVMGHVDHCGVLENKQQQDQDKFWQYDFKIETADPVNYLIHKGSVTVNGVSLTINQVRKTDLAVFFSVMLIPHTLSQTNLGQLQRSERVNIEYDYLTRIVLSQPVKNN